MSDIVVEGGNEFKAIKVELGEDQEWKKRFSVDSFPDFGVFVNGEYSSFRGRKEAGYSMRFSLTPSDLLHFAANHTSDGILRVTDEYSIDYLSKHGNGLILSLFDEDVGSFSSP